MSECELCRGTRHLRRGGRWVRCVCMAAALSSLYVHPVLRGSNDSVPELYFSKPPLPLQTYVAVSGDLAAGGHWDVFRLQVWRSLLAYEPRDITHDVVFFNRFSDIVTGREQTDDEHSDTPTVRELVRLDVLVVVISAYDIANRLTRSVFGNLLDERESAGRATWVYSHVNGASLRYLLDEPIYRRWFAQADAHAPAAPLHLAPSPGRPGTSTQPEPPYVEGGGGARRYR